jgi:hypothetical protein
MGDVMWADNGNVIAVGAACAISNLSILSTGVQGFVGRLFGLHAVCSPHPDDNLWSIDRRGAEL